MCHYTMLHETPCNSDVFIPCQSRCVFSVNFNLHPNFGKRGPKSHMKLKWHESFVEDLKRNSIVTRNHACLKSIAQKSVAFCALSTKLWCCTKTWQHWGCQRMETYNQPHITTYQTSYLQHNYKGMEVLSLELLHGWVLNTCF